MPNAVLEVTGLVKDFGKFRAVDGISFSVPKGKIIGFLGPNGAGKTTTIQMLVDIITPTAGSIRYFGKEFHQHKAEICQRINHTSAFNSLLGRISTWENLRVYADLYGIKNPEKKIKELVDYFEAGDFIHTRYWSLSTGQKTRANIIKALINDPELILMDEPTASLDPDIADRMLTVIESLRKEHELTIFYTSHDMQEVTRICDEVIFLDRGKIVAHDTPLGLTKRIKKASLKLTFTTSIDGVKRYLEENKCEYLFSNKNTVTITTEEQLIPKLIFGLSKAEVFMTDIEIIKPNLADVFLQIARGEK